MEPLDLSMKGTGPLNLSRKKTSDAIVVQESSMQEYPLDLRTVKSVEHESEAVTAASAAVTRLVNYSISASSDDGSDIEEDDANWVPPLPPGSPPNEFIPPLPPRPPSDEFIPPLPPGSPPATFIPPLPPDSQPPSSNLSASPSLSTTFDSETSGWTPVGPADQLEGFDPTSYYQVEQQKPLEFKSGRVSEYAFKLHIVKPLEDEDDLQRMAQLEAILGHAFFTLFHHLDPKYKGQVFVHNPALLSNVKPTPWREIGNFSSGFLASFLMAAEQSPKETEENDGYPEIRIEDCTFTLVVYKPPSLDKPIAIGGGGNRREKQQQQPWDQQMKKKKNTNQASGMKARNELSMINYVRKSSSYLDPMADDRVPESMKRLCIPMCVILALKRFQLKIQPPGEEDPERGRKSIDFNLYRRSVLMREQTKDLVRNAGLEPPVGPFSIEQIGQIQAYLGPDYQINIYSSDKPPDKSFGPDRAPFHINLLIREDLLPQPEQGKAHAVLITNLRGFYGKKRMVCSVCKKVYYREASHRCEAAGCRHCKLDYCQNEDNRKIMEPYAHCQDCDRTFFTEGCFKAHKKDQCKNRSRCQLCRQVMKRNKLSTHACGHRRCQHCKLLHLSTEWCYVRPAKGKSSPYHPVNQKEKLKPPTRNQSKKKKKKMKKGGKKRKKNKYVDEEEDDDDDVLSELGLCMSEEDEELSEDDGRGYEEFYTNSSSDEEDEEEEEEIMDMDNAAIQEEEEEGPSIEELLSRKLLWYADCETYVDPVSQEHTANLLVLQRPLYLEEKRRLGKDYEERKFKGPTAMRQFVAECMKENSEYAGYTVIYHNASGFDGHLWHRELLLADSPPKNAIYKGERILTFTMAQNNVKVLDSLQFIPGTSLAQFPDMFELKTGSKLEFPHKLNTPEWLDFSHPEKVYEEYDEEGRLHRYPQRKYFHLENKRPKELEQFEIDYQAKLKEYEDDPNRKFKPVREFKRYCCQDVRILREGCEKMRASWLEQFADMEIFDYTTFPSFNNALFRTKYMPRNSMVLLPPQGFHHKNRRYSVEAMAWMSAERFRMAEKLGRPLVKFRHARSGYEVVIAGYPVDGYGEEADGSKHVFQFHGCVWHGCSCTPDRANYSEEFKLMRRLHHQNTQACDNFLRQLGQNPQSPYGKFEYHVIWGCEFDQMKEESKAGEDPSYNSKKKKKKKDDQTEEENKEEDGSWLHQYYEDFMLNWTSTEDRLCLEHGFKGGRVNAIKHYVPELKPGWGMGYYDFNSLYPSINFGVHGEEWPLGEPDVYIGYEIEAFRAPGLESEECFGVWKVDVLPPQNLRHPILPQTVEDKLLFHLCSRCAVNKKPGPCNHSDRSRMMRKVTFFTGELKKAVLQHGYKILRVYEIWNWPSERRSKDLFKGMIRDQYAKKVLSSKVKPADIPRIIEEHKAMGLNLQPEQFKYNPALRALTKFSLNNIWGFLGKREDVCTTRFTDDELELEKVENDPKLEISSVRLAMNGTYLRIQYKPKENSAGKNGNIVLALLTTAYARLCLYGVIEKYEEETCYFDTDSVILMLGPGVSPPPTSSSLGELKDEIKDAFPTGFMASFITIGSKSYTFKVEDEVTHAILKHPMKLKGISLTYNAVKVINPQVMQKMVSLLWLMGASRGLGLFEVQAKLRKENGDEEEGEDEELVEVPQFQIRRRLAQGSLFNANLIKHVSFSSDKRWILPQPNPHLDTRPYGFNSNPSSSTSKRRKKTKKS